MSAENESLHQGQREDGLRSASRVTLDLVMPGIQVGLLLAMLPMVAWIFALMIQPVQLSIEGLHADLQELRAEVRRVDEKIDNVEARPPNETVMTHIEAITKRLDRLEQQ